MHDDLAGYHQFTAEDGDYTRWGSFEIFHSDGVTLGSDYPAGWYWWPCFPGCLPEADPSGPFDTAREALESADPYNPAAN